MGMHELRAIAEKARDGESESIHHISVFTGPCVLKMLEWIERAREELTIMADYDLLDKHVEKLRKLIAEVDAL